MHINIDGQNISYRITGEGDGNVIILQGWGTGCRLYDSVAGAINDRYRVVQFDLPGFGESGEPESPWNVDAYAGFFLDFVKALNIKKAILLGHSYGGRIIIKLASRDGLPFDIDRIILVDSAGVMPVRSTRQKLAVARYKLLKRIGGAKLIYALFPEVVDEWRSRQGSEDYRNATPVMRQALVMAVNEDLTDFLQYIKADTLLIWGEQDRDTPLGDARIMERLIPGSGLAVIKDAGHYCFLEQPELFRNIIRSYLHI